ncbi:MAG: hypothetical protein GC206_12825 [Alphaproteobacteria bacterium]|nr:hypothetical protein [Alphaproteobacteria bacterium]
MIKPEILLAGIDDLLRTIPSADELKNDADGVGAWRGKAIAVVTAWNLMKGNLVETLLSRFDEDYVYEPDDVSLRKIRNVLHEARHAALLQSDSVSVAIPAGSVFQYFSELRGRIALATQEVFFIDPYLNAEFVERYLTQVKAGTRIRLLTNKYLPQLLPAVDLFVRQHSATVEVREAPGFHDRYLFIDKTVGFQSGASFKDGATKAPTGIVEIVDVLSATLQQYEALWAKATVHR